MQKTQRRKNRRRGKPVFNNEKLTSFMKLIKANPDNCHRKRNNKLSLNTFKESVGYKLSQEEVMCDIIL